MTCSHVMSDTELTKLDMERDEKNTVQKHFGQSKY